MGLKPGLVRGTACDYHLEITFKIVIVVPVRAKLYDFGVEVCTHAPTHTDNHTFALKYFKTIFKMIYYVAGKFAEIVFTSDNRLKP
jgi:hypothetical protein